MWTCILFDLDDTFYDYSCYYQNQADKRALSMISYRPSLPVRYMGVKLATSRIYKLGGIGHDAFFDRYLRYKLLLKSLVLDEKYARVMDRAFIDELKCLKPYDEVIPLLNKLKTLGYRTGVLTNGLRKYQSVKINALGISHLLDYFFCSQDAKAPKPKQAFFEHFLKRNRLSASECIYIGDHPINDAEGARKAGMSSLLYDPEEKYPCHKSLSSLSDLLSTL